MLDLTNLGTSIFATGIGATLITQFKGSIQDFFQFFRLGYSITASTEGNLKAYNSLRDFVLKYPGHFHKTTSYDSYHQYREQQMGYGKFLICPNWNQLIVVNHEKIKKDNGPNFQTLTVKIYGYKAKALYNEVVSKINNNIHTTDISIYNSERYMEGVVYSSPRDFSTIFHPQKQKIIDFLEGFKNKEEIYKKNGLAYKTGLLLYGPPGTGKTSMIKAIASYLNYDIVVPNSNLESYDIFRGNIIVCVEDIDRFLDEDDVEDSSDPITVNTSSKEKDKNSKLHKLLQMFDGLFSPSNTIFIATTNHIEALPEELIRDGRFDCKICLDNIDKIYAEQMCANFGVKLEDVVSKDQSYPINPAYLQNKILQSLNPISEI